MRFISKGRRIQISLLFQENPQEILSSFLDLFCSFVCLENNFDQEQSLVRVLYYYHKTKNC